MSCSSLGNLRKKNTTTNNNIITHNVYVIKNLRDSVYIGYTNDTKHRIRMHNGEIVGGAKRTKNRGPWEHVCVVSGFPTHQEALRFEWALQHPYRSKKSKGLLTSLLVGKKNVGKQRSVKRTLIEMNYMISLIEPWRSIALTVTFANVTYLQLALLAKVENPHRQLVTSFPVIDSNTIPPAEHSLDDLEESDKENGNDNTILIIDDDDDD